MRDASRLPCRSNVGAGEPITEFWPLDHRTSLLRPCGVTRNQRQCEQGGLSAVSAPVRLHPHASSVLLCVTSASLHDPTARRLQDKVDIRRVSPAQHSRGAGAPAGARCCDVYHGVWLAFEFPMPTRSPLGGPGRLRRLNGPAAESVLVDQLPPRTRFRVTLRTIRRWDRAGSGPFSARIGLEDECAPARDQRHQVRRSPPQPSQGPPGRPAPPGAHPCTRWRRRYAARRERAGRPRSATLRRFAAASAGILATRPISAQRRAPPAPDADTGRRQTPRPPLSQMVSGSKIRAAWRSRPRSAAAPGGRERACSAQL